MINLFELRNRLINTIGASYDIYSKNPLISLISSIINDITGYKDRFKELKDCEIDYLPLSYYSIRCLYFSGSIATSILELDSILNELEICKIGIVFDGNYYAKRVTILKKLLKSFADFNWIPSDFEKKSNALILKKK